MITLQELAQALLNGASILVNVHSGKWHEGELRIGEIHYPLSESEFNGIAPYLRMDDITQPITGTRYVPRQRWGDDGQEIQWMEEERIVRDQSWYLFRAAVGDEDQRFLRELVGTMERIVIIDGVIMTARIAIYPATGQTGIAVFDNDGPYMGLTIAMPGVALAPNEVIVPTYKIDGALISDLEQQGFWTPTGREIAMPFGTAPVYSLKEVRS